MCPEFPGWGMRRVDEARKYDSNFLYYRHGQWIECHKRPDLVDDRLLSTFLPKGGKHRKR